VPETELPGAAPCPAVDRDPPVGWVPFFPNMRVPFFPSFFLGHAPFPPLGTAVRKDAFLRKGGNPLRSNINPFPPFPLLGMRENVTWPGHLSGDGEEPLLSSGGRNENSPHQPQPSTFLREIGLWESDVLSPLPSFSWREGLRDGVAQHPCSGTKAARKGLLCGERRYKDKWIPPPAAKAKQRCPLFPSGK